MDFVIITRQPVPASEFNLNLIKMHNYSLNDNPQMVRVVRFDAENIHDRQIRKFKSFEEAQSMKKFYDRPHVILHCDFKEILSLNEIKEFEKKASLL